MRQAIIVAASLLLGTIGFVIGVEKERREPNQVVTVYLPAGLNGPCTWGASSIGPVQLQPDGSFKGDTTPERTGC